MGNGNNCESKNNGLDGALKGFNNIKGSYRITHNGKFSPKIIQVDGEEEVKHE